MSQIANRRRFLCGAVRATAASVAPPRASALGTYDIASGGGSIVMQRHVSIAGADRSSVVFVASEAMG